MPRYPADASPELIRVLEGILTDIENMKRQNTDFHKRRLTNVGAAVSRGDLITKGQFDDAIEEIKGKVVSGQKQIRRIFGTGPVPFDPGSGNGGGTGSGGAFPAPNHGIDFGYYKVDTVQYGQFASEVKSFTNLTYIDPSDCGFSSPPTPASDRFANLQGALSRLTSSGLKVILSVDRGDLLTIGSTLQAAQSFWSKIKYVFLGDELSMAQTDINAEINNIRNVISNLGLAQKPIGALFTPQVVLHGDSVLASELDVIAIENYMIYTSDATGALSSAEDVALMTDLVDRQRSKIPAGKPIVLVIQAYDLNGSFTKVTPNLVDLQKAAYLAVRNDTRVGDILCFSWGRPGGVKSHLELKPPHQSIWAAIAGAVSGTSRCNQGRPCCGGVGNPDDCPRWCSGGDYQDSVAASYYNYLTTAPAGVIDGANPNHILDIAAFMAGVVAQVKVDTPTITAAVSPGHDGKEITVKRVGDSEFSEQYALWAGNQELISWTGSPPKAYRATCYPALI